MFYLFQLNMHYVSLTSTYVILGPRLAFVRPNLPFDVHAWLISKLISEHRKTFHHIVK